MFAEDQARYLRSRVERAGMDIALPWRLLPWKVHRLLRKATLRSPRPSTPLPAFPHPVASTANAKRPFHADGFAAYEVRCGFGYELLPTATSRSTTAPPVQVGSAKRA